METPDLKPQTYIVITKTEIVKSDNLRTSFRVMRNLCRGKKEIHAAEIGVWEGVNAKYMLVDCPELKLYLVDDWENVVVYTGGPIQNKEYRDLLKSIAEFNLLEFRERKFFTYQNSQTAVKNFKDDFLDYVYIDGEHEYPAVKRDLNLWYPKVKSGGILGGHDVAMKEVSTALDEFIKENNIADNKWGKDDTAYPGRSDFWIFK